ncbi:hypothetical protein ACFV9E_02325 [Streptomyces sp. NPDC059835]|uniref:hypothetical protein n=1 Tax=Streptomyces sp. NPDC059835 TaxID=3346967 RepID=UPI0036572C42
MALQKSTVALTVVGVAAGVAAFVAASGRDRAALGDPLGWGNVPDSSCGGPNTCGTESSCGTAYCGNGM